ncbi:hypothetical protein D9619_004503 [Psilocybe cf. subviscida]|uniref:DUF6534 domain-containing protein n=1 Tax=Psilocybe cf. subviscida TaxID=2480587 RepID=A0A8H5BPZ4_9AGAR|nr:hypothetical protein D9619_004503 [Psilocybe cf. subviscida]
MRTWYLWAASSGYSNSLHSLPFSFALSFFSIQEWSDKMGQYDMVIGVLLIGLFLNTYLFGLVTYQFIVYHNTKFNDRSWIKALVGVLFVLDLAQSMVVVYAGWEMCVTNYNHPESLGIISWTIPFTACGNAVIAFISQIFLGHRVLVMTKNKVLVGVIGAFSCAGLIGGLYAGTWSGILKYIVKFPALDPVVTLWLGSQTAADLLITVSLTWVLSRSRTGFRRTDTIINRVIRGCVQTGLFVSIFAMADMFSFLFSRDTYLYAMFAYPLGRIYTNTLLDTLNARSALKGISAGSDVFDNDEMALSYRMPNSTHRTAVGGNTIHVQKEIITDLVDEERASQRTVDRKYAAED